MAKHYEMIDDYVLVDGDYQYCDNHGFLIRCRDCKMAIEKTRGAFGEPSVVCGRDRETYREDWYCAGAERKTE